ncbi:MAG: UDP-N-acetylmuramate:L-alanyl-gamma-D-glutamyl-meso-diaminopimelate ligase [Betaproteobacteria bacterium RIFCSPLOWO2_02_FULL_67_26]|nr:MAG: UDP-N-acetylmuramate:L-alanyl-gamma-D-glutamyl-meso-diaminopimelate ligase [Betaproteobacteria bacterium RIFCSPLOWO2_02_FULL_67_26]
MHLHILGICGTFMGGLALIARAAGHRVTGCDANVYPPMSTQLAAQGIELIEGWNADQVALKPDVFVIGNVVTRGNPLMEEILERGFPYISGPQWLRENVLVGKRGIAVAGTHGKTTVAAMLSWVLEHAGLEPGFLIGGVPGNFGVSARLTNSRFFVVEADEYDTAFFDKRSKFLHYPARTTILNNLEFDHADIFPDLAAIETQFHHFVRTLPANGLIVANGADEALARVLARGCYTPVERFGAPEGWSIGAQDAGGFEVRWKREAQGRVAWSLTGAHNQANALAAIAAARHCGVAPAQAIAALGAFEGVKRRMELRGVVNGISVYDDFAHHPTAIETTLAGLRARVDGARVIAVLEPRSNTMKLGAMRDRLAASLAPADRVFCYSAGLKWDAAAALAPLGAKAEAHADFDRLLAALASAARPGDHVVIMSNGGFGGIHDKLLALLAQGKP